MPNKIYEDKNNYTIKKKLVRINQSKLKIIHIVYTECESDGARINGLSEKTQDKSTIIT